MKYGYRVSGGKGNENVTKKDLLDGFVDNTTAHGIPNIHNATGFLKKGSWLLILLAVCGILTYHMYSIVTSFLAYNTNIQISILQQYQMSFPTVTICNLNPVKNSSLTESPYLTGLLNNQGKRRRKRFLDFDCAVSGVKSQQHGLCVDIFSDATTMGMTSAETACVGQEAGLYQPVSQSIHDFVVNSALFTQSLSFEKYWIYLISGKWSDTLPASWTNWNPLLKGPFPGALAFINYNHTWGNAALASKYHFLCQKMIECPYPVYDPSGNSICYFMPLGDAVTTYSKAKDFCSSYDPEAILIELNTQDKSTFFLQSVAPVIFSSQSVDSFWLGIESFTWASSTVMTWSNWANDNGTVKEHGIVNRSRNNQWYFADSNVTAAVICQKEGIQYNGYSDSVSITPASTTTTEIPFLYDKTVTETFQESELVIETIASIPEKLKREIGYQSFELVLDCTYQGWQCHDGMFYQYTHPMYGNCYMFNSGWNKSYPVEISHRTGRRYGLLLTLNIGEDEYINKIGGAIGLRVAIHPQSKMPHPEQEGLLLEPGKLTSVGVKKVAIERKPAPHGDCVEDVNRISEDVYAEMYAVNYSRQNCFQTCYQRYVMKECRCYDAYYPNKGSAFANFSGSDTVCSIYDKTQDLCKQSVQTRYTGGELDCSQRCPEACYEEYFITSPSSAVWPSNIHKSQVENHLGSKVPKAYWINDSTKYQRNLLQLEVFLEDFNYEKILETEAYQIVQLASDIGGMLGLWIGCSAISIIELLELGLDLIVLGMFKNCCKKNVRRERKLTPAFTKTKRIHDA